LNRGPITALFSPPQSCTATLSKRQTGGGIFLGHLDDPYFDPSCYPTGTLQTQDFYSTSAWGAYYYSPAICPFEWTTAMLFKSSFPAYASTFISLDPQTTVAVCCPSGFSYQAFGHQCSSLVTPNQVLTYISARTQGAAGWDRGSVSMTTVTSSFAVVGDGVPIWWQSSDLEVLAAAKRYTPTTTTASDTAATSSLATTTGSANPTSSVNAPPPPKGQSKSLPVGVKICVGVGVPVLFIAVLTIILYFLRR
ncbi:hypothetical protein CC80DRAFT_378763, partial [Byssothecium circinans]